MAQDERVNRDQHQAPAEGSLVSDRDQETNFKELSKATNR